MIRRLSLSLLLPLLVALAVGGCASTRFVEPQVSLIDIHVADMTLFETTAVFHLRLHNENPRPLVLDGGVYDFSINGVEVGRGMTTDRVRIPRYESGEAEVVVYLRNGALVRRIGSILESGGLEYRVDARHFVQTGFGRREFDSVSRGRLSLGGERERWGRRRPARE